MATLTAAEPRTYEQRGHKESLPVIASDIIYGGAAVGENGSGSSRPLVAGDPFQGFSYRTADNSSGSAGDKRVTVYTDGRIVLNVTGVVLASNDGDAVYASDDNTFTLTSTSNSLIGWVSRYISDGKAVVRFKATEAGT